MFKKAKKGKIIWKFGQKCTKFENISRTGMWLCAIIANNRLLKQDLTAADWHLKVKDTEYDVGLTKNYCISVSMQKLNSIHKLIFKIQQILGSRELNDHAYFDHVQPKIIEITFNFPESVQAYKKSGHSIYSIQF